MSITIVIPCYKRAEFLITALESVRKQTVLNYVDKIIVSENSSNQESKKVCEQFSDLNIEYHQQMNNLTMVEHLSWIIDQSQSQYTAMLHDDDWWYPTHLEMGFDALSKDTNVSCYFSNFIFCKNEILCGAFFHYPDIITYFTEKTNNINSIQLNFKSVASIAYLFTPFHMSSMIAKTPILQSVNKAVLLKAKPWYADRILYPYLSLNGLIEFNPQVLCAVRLHSNNDANTIDFQDRINSHREGSEKINKLGIEHNVDVIDNWNNIKLKVGKDEWALIQNIFRTYFSETKDENSPFYEYKQNQTFMKSVKNILPHAIWVSMSKVFKLNEK